MGSWVAAALATVALVLPVDGPVVRPFDAPDGPFAAGHRGVDLAAGPGAQVRAAAAGTVRFAGPVAGAGWLALDHGGGLATTYGHLDDLLVAEGDRVEAGDVLGRVADGRDHLDWGARRDGEYVDPLGLLGAAAGWRVALVDPDRLDELAAAVTATVTVTAPAAGTTGSGRLTVWPARGPVTSRYGMRTHPLTGDRRLHAGVDVAAPTGAPILAAGAGRVTRAGPAGGYGNLVEIDHGAGLATRYAHASVVLVATGALVAAGTPVARVGSTGASTGPHLHFEVRERGRPVDPLALFPPG